MMPRAVLQVAEPVMRKVWQHLFESERSAEEAGFLFVRPITVGQYSYEAVDWYAVPLEGYALTSAYHFELTDETRAQVIKQAYDLDASLVEIHSHLGQEPPFFSPSDLLGFRQFVPHVWWRLRGKPYFALVASVGGIDAIAWIEGPAAPERLAAIHVDGRPIVPTGRSPLRWTPEYDGYAHE